MEPPNSNDQMLHEIYRLSRANNELLHHMRRSAFFWGFIKFVIYGVLILAPIWFYVTYLNGTVNTMLNDLNKMEGVSTQAQNQFQGFENAWEQFESRFTGATTTQQ